MVQISSRHRRHLVRVRSSEKLLLDIVHRNLRFDDKRFEILMRLLYGSFAAGPFLRKGRQRFAANAKVNKLRHLFRRRSSCYFKVNRPLRPAIVTTKSPGSTTGLLSVPMNDRSLELSLK